MSTSCEGVLNPRLFSLFAPVTCDSLNHCIYYGVIEEELQLKSRKETKN